MHATISYFFTLIVNMNKVETCMHNKCWGCTEMLPFVSIMGIFGFGAPFSLKNLLEESSPALQTGTAIHSEQSSLQVKNIMKAAR